MAVNATPEAGQAGEDGSARRVKRSWREIASALRQRKVAVMLALGVASGLPFSALAGTLNAWFTQAGVEVGTIGVISFIGLAYSFNFLWAPALQSTRPPGLARFGSRRGWMIVFQVITVAALILVALSDPQRSLGVLTLAAAVGALASASLHVVVDAWRIEVADDATPLDLMSSVYQAGFRTAGFIAGAVALLLADPDRLGWNNTYYLVAGVALLCLVASLAAPEPNAKAGSDDGKGARDLPREVGGDLRPEVRAAVLALVLVGWAWAAITIAAFMVVSVTQDPKPSATAFTRAQGPWIVLATVLAPALLAILTFHLRTRAGACGSPRLALAHTPLGQRVLRVTDTLYGAILAPLIDLMGRLRWAAALVLLIALSYRFTDQVWGAFAFTFYLGDPAVAAGALQHSLDDVFIASKTFGVVMTITGIVVGGAAILRFGRMPVLFVGAILAALTNLLFADLAYGAAGLDAFLGVTRLDAVFAWLGFDQRMARLMTAIAGENLAIGVASAAFVAYLSSVVNPRYAAVQYALLASLALLIGTLGRGALGEMIERDGFGPVFVLTAWLGLVAVVVSGAEWFRLARARSSAG